MEKTINLVGGIGTSWGHTFHQEGRVYRGGVFANYDNRNCEWVIR
jgi:hypothetical protein